MMAIINVLCINNLQFKNTYFGDEDIGATLTDRKLLVQSNAGLIASLIPYRNKFCLEHM